MVAGSVDVADIRMRAGAGKNPEVCDLRYRGGEFLKPRDERLIDLEVALCHLCTYS